MPITAISRISAPKTIINGETIINYLNDDNVKLFSNKEKMKIIDISIPLSNETPVWEGDEGVNIRQVSFRGDGSDFNVSRAEFGVHAGTHIDAPFHLFNNGRYVDQIPLEVLVGKATILEIPTTFDTINAEALKAGGFKGGIERLILKTRNTNFWIEDPHTFHNDFIGIDREGADYLVGEGVKLIGLDYFSISPMSDLVRPHEVLLGAGIVIMENVYLVNIEPGEYQLICLPLKLIGTDGAPVRAILIDGYF